MARAIWVIIGCLALGLGAIGVALPVLPTTPFVLLAAFAFAKGSPRLRDKLLQHHIFGPIIRDWNAKGAIAPRYKTLALAMMAAAFLASVLFGLSRNILIVQGVCIMMAATFILSRPNS